MILQISNLKILNQKQKRINKRCEDSFVATFKKAQKKQQVASLN